MRIASEADIDAVTETIALAFATDPTWGPALAREDGSTEHHMDYWRIFVEGALPHGSIFRSDDGAAVAVWIPPGEDEMSEDQEAQLRLVVTENLGPEAQDAMFALWDRFDSSHPQSEPHAYLSLLATHPDHRGKGIAQTLLRENLADFDASGLPTYLESTNPANDHRYERMGFAKIGEFAGSVEGSVVSTMWRPVGG
jgi:ribosomal protein S18 acetylase RimI-like enzyme